MGGHVVLVSVSSFRKCTKPKCECPPRDGQVSGEVLLPGSVPHSAELGVHRAFFSAHRHVETPALFPIKPKNDSCIKQGCRSVWASVSSTVHRQSSLKAGFQMCPVPPLATSP